MRSNVFENYNAHSLWVVELLCLGPFRHVPRPLYRHVERNVDGSVAKGWRDWPPERRYAAMAEYTLQCIQTVSTLGEGDAAERQAIVLLLVLRLLTHSESAKAFPAEAHAVDRHLIRAAELLARAYGLPYLDSATAGRLRLSPDHRRLVAKLRLKDAFETIAVQDFAAASVALHAAAGMGAEKGELQRRWAQLHRHKGDFEAARSAILEAERLLPGDAGVQTELAQIRLQAGDVDGCLAAATSAVAINPKLAGAHHLRSVALLRSKRLEEALAAMDAALAIDPAKEKFRLHREKIRRQIAEASGNRTTQGALSPNASSTANGCKRN